MYIQELRDVLLRDQLRRYVYDVIGCCQDVHREKGPELTEYVYQECLDIAFEEASIKHTKEYFFHPMFRGKKLKSALRVDFFCKDKIFLECKAIEELSFHERVQLTNYMRNAGIHIGILYNFAPLKAECEKFYLDTATNQIYYF